MTRDDVIRMVREAGFIPNDQHERAWLERFAALVAAKERGECAAHYVGVMRAAVAHEREACALVSESEWTTDDERKYGEVLAAAIRARGAA